MLHTDNEVAIFPRMSWATVLIKELIHQGVRAFCLSPGSRQTPLTFAIAQHPLAEASMHFDERGTAFHALGRAKGSLSPVAIVVTSGTAIANVFPAVMEAYASHTPLIVISADLPPEELDVQAMQATDQVKFFGSYVHWQVDIPCEDPEIDPRFIGSMVAQAVYRAKEGPVHINCHFREPFIREGHSERSHRPQTLYTRTERVIDEASLEYIADELSGIEKGVIIAGKLRSTQLDPLFTLARRLQWPILPDILSEVRSFGAHDFVIPHFDFIIDQCDAILHLGDKFVSKKLLMKVPTICHVAAYPDRVDPLLGVTHRVECPPLTFCEKLHPLIGGPPRNGWLGDWRSRAATLPKKLKTQLNDLSEISVALLLAEIMDESRGLFLGNSMPIRDANQFFFPEQKVGPIAANRGLSGIDGTIASAIGFSMGIEKGVVAVIGDLSFLHDINSLAQHAPYPITYIVINNQGGGIFSFLPIHEKKEFFEPFIATPHSYHFNKAAELFNIEYQRIESIEALRKAVTLPRDESLLLEVVTDREENLRLHKSLEHTCQLSKELVYD